MNEKTALVTGGSRGIGRGIVLALAERGWKVGINYRKDHEAAERTLEQVRGMGGDGMLIQADISSREDRQELVENVYAAWPHLDLLVNNAGIAPAQRVDLLALTEESYDRVMEVNLKGPFFLTILAARKMIESFEKDAGRSPMIININSISAYASSTRRGEYCISKAGMGMMTALLADRLAEEGIRVYEIRPGIIKTDMTAGVKEKYDALFSEGLTPIQRWGQPGDVAAAVAALAEGALPYSTGEVINVDGGFHLRRL